MFFLFFIIASLLGSYLTVSTQAIAALSDVYRGRFSRFSHAFSSKILNDIFQESSKIAGFQQLG